MKYINTRAFSLLEIVVSMLILSLVVSGPYGLFITNHKFISEAGHRLQAIQYARQVAETLKVYVSASNTAPAPANAGTLDGSALDGDGAGEVHNDLTTIGITDPITINGITYNGSYTVVENKTVDSTPTYT